MRRAASRGRPARGGVVAGHLQQVGAHGGEAVVAGDALVGVERRRAARGRRCGPVHHGDRDRPVERDHRVGRDALEQVVEGEDLRPVGVLGAWPPRRAPRRSPPAAGTGRAARSASVSRDERRRPRRSTPGPTRAVLLGERDSAPSGAGARGAARRRSAASARAARRPRRRRAAGRALRGSAGSPRGVRSPRAAGRGPTSRCSPR